MKYNRPFFSIATPCYNSQSTIERTIKSILSQDFDNYEYIIIDGGSTDDTINIIKKYEPLFNGRMKWISEKDNGLYDAFNKGIKNSNGVYCWNVNSDDYITEHALKRIFQYIQERKWSKLPIISGRMNLVSNEGKIIESSCSDKSKLKIAYENDYIGIPHPATLVPKDVYDKYGGFDIRYKIIGDADWFHRVYKAGVPFAFIDFVVSNMSDGGISNQFNYSKSLKDRIIFLNKHYKNPITKIIHWVKWTRTFYLLKHKHQLLRK